MPDQQEAEAISDPSVEIGNSLASVWARYAGVRPQHTETQMEGTVVRWIVTGGTNEFTDGMTAENAERGPAVTELTLEGFKRETAAAVARVTRLKVVAMISSHDAKTGIATETFVLDMGRKKY
jgi:hypothetical protein